MTEKEQLIGEQDLDGLPNELIKELTIGAKGITKKRIRRKAEQIIMTEQEIKTLISENKKLKKAVKHLTDSVMIYLNAVDRDIGPNKDIPKDISSYIAILSNWLDNQNDSVRYNALHINFRTDDKRKYLRKLLRRTAEK